MVDFSELKKLFNSDTFKDEFDNIVPIVTTEGVTSAYITNDIGEPDEFNRLCHKLATAKTTDKFVLHLNTRGGVVDSAFMLCDAISNCKGTVTAHISGTCASAGTIIAMACDDIYIAPHTLFMIHNYSAGVQGKGHEMKARQEFLDTSLNTAFKMFYTGFLTSKEMDSVIEGKDLWMGTEEVRQRWQNKLASSKTANVVDTKTVKTKVLSKKSAPVATTRGRPKKSS